jgi:hypothetical protein
LECTLKAKSEIRSDGTVQKAIAEAGVRGVRVHGVLTGFKGMSALAQKRTFAVQQPMFAKDQ